MTMDHSKKSRTTHFTPSKQQKDRGHMSWIIMTNL